MSCEASLNSPTHIFRHPKPRIWGWPRDQSQSQYIIPSYSINLHATVRFHILSLRPLFQVNRQQHMEENARLRATLAEWSLMNAKGEARNNKTRAELEQSQRKLQTLLSFGRPGSPASGPASGPASASASAPVSARSSPVPEGSQRPDLSGEL